MAAFFGNLKAVVITSFVLALLLVGVYCATQGFDGVAFELFVLRWLHIACGVMWIGLLWYFNFVQIPTMPKIPAELKPAVGGYIAPAALFWFRWAAMGTIMWFNVWFVIWPNQQKALNIAGKYPDLNADQKAAAGKTAMIFSRVNTLLSIPMLFSMVAAGHLY